MSKRCSFCSVHILLSACACCGAVAEMRREQFGCRRCCGNPRFVLEGKNNRNNDGVLQAPVECQTACWKCHLLRAEPHLANH